MNQQNSLLSLLNIPPTITAWNRMEGRPRTEDFDRALKAEVRDPLWMLSRQWQMGEFIGDDAASPVFAKVHLKTTALNKYQPGNSTAQALSSDVPLEVKVEHQAIPFQLMGQNASLDLRVMMGRQWLKLLKGLAFAQVTAQEAKQAYLTQYPIERPDPHDPQDILECAHLDAWQQKVALAGRGLDGYQLYVYLKADANHHAYDQLSLSLEASEQDELDQLAQRFIAWFEKLYYQPLTEGNPSWQANRLEHQFACSAPQGTNEKVLVADEYYHGHLDWYNLDIHPQLEELGEVPGLTDTDLEQSTTLSFIPSVVTFEGMPRTRWWEFEESKTNFGDIKPDTTDLNKLLLLDFALLYANDWFLLPFTLPTGSIANVEGLSVTNVFGERIWVDAAGKGSDEDWQRWNMYSLNIKGTEDIPADLSLVVLPSSPKILEAPPSEQVYLLRDEAANMVWAVEGKVPLLTGKSKAGKEAAEELQTKHQQFVTPEAAPALFENQAKVQYQLVNSVPENWIPFMPVHLPNDIRQVQLQRAAMPRLLKGDTQPPRKIEPRTSLLREGLDQDSKEPYFLYEEEVPRAGIRVQKSFQRTRWYNGQVYTWIGIRKQTGRGEGQSGLAFDRLLAKEKNE